MRDRGDHVLTEWAMGRDRRTPYEVAISHGVPPVRLISRPTVEQVRQLLESGDLAVLIGWDIPPACRGCGIRVDPVFGDPLPDLCFLCERGERKT